MHTIDYMDSTNFTDIILNLILKNDNILLFVYIHMDILIDFSIRNLRSKKSSPCFSYAYIVPVYQTLHTLPPCYSIVMCNIIMIVLYIMIFFLIFLLILSNFRPQVHIVIYIVL